MVNALSSFQDINTIIIKASQSEIDLNRCIEATKQVFKDLAPSKERRYIRVWHKKAVEFATPIHEDVYYVPDYYSEVPI
jgi:hypothetical protein